MHWGADMSIPESFLADLRERVDIVEVVERHVELKRVGVTLKGLCPFHRETTPSFVVTPERQTYHCFGCGVHGNVIAFLMAHVGHSFTEAVSELAAQVGMAVPTGGGERAARPGRARLITAREALDVIELEVQVVAVVASDMHCDREITSADHDRLFVAVQRINAVLSETRP